MSINKNSIIWNNPDEFDSNSDDFIDTNLNNNDIHISLKPNGNKTTTVITGLSFDSKIKTDDFLKNIKKKFGINGCFKSSKVKEKNKHEDNSEDSDDDKKNKKKPIVIEDEKIFIFSGDNRDKIQNYLINELKFESDCIKIHG